MIEIDGRIVYDPQAISGNSEALFKPWWVIVSFGDSEISDFYSWLVYKRTSVKLQKPAWGSHVSVVRGEVPPNADKWKEWDGEIVKIIYDPDVRTNGNHWWLRASCPRLGDLRENLGLSRDGWYNLHITIGIAIPRDYERSNIALKSLMRFPEY